MRGWNFFMYVGVFSIVGWWKGNYYDEWVTKPKQVLAQKELEGIV